VVQVVRNLAFVGFSYIPMLNTTVALLRLLDSIPTWSIYPYNCNKIE